MSSEEKLEQLKFALETIKDIGSEAKTWADGIACAKIAEEVLEKTK